MTIKIPVAIVGVGNCASSLIQGISYYKRNDVRTGLQHLEIGGYKPEDVEIVCAFDIDERKVGKNLETAIFSPPNNTAIFWKDISNPPVVVEMGKILDSYSPHLKEYNESVAIQIAKHKEPTQQKIVESLVSSGAQVLVNFLPVGSEEATKFYMECALEARVAVLNCIPCFIASNTVWSEKFARYKLPIIGDDIKAQVGATIVHRVLSNLFKDRGAQLKNTYQLNVGGNLDFLNMLNRSRLTSKKISKTAAVQSVLEKELPADQIHIGPSDYIPWLKDNKVCYLRIEGNIFGNVPMNLEVRLSVEDSPNSAGMVIDGIRCLKLALSRGDSGAIEDVSAYLMKHPPKQFPDDIAWEMMQSYIDLFPNFKSEVA